VEGDIFKGLGWTLDAYLASLQPRDSREREREREREKKKKEWEYFGEFWAIIFKEGNPYIYHKLGVYWFHFVMLSKLINYRN
jgi:hypothetical protein